MSFENDKLETGSKNKNNSGEGSGSPVPPSVAHRFNWGAFTFAWIWGIFNKSFITLLYFLTGFIPGINLGFLIWFGIKGNEWAWQNKKWRSVEHFHMVQKRWAIASCIVLILCTISTVLFIVSIFAIMAASGGEGITSIFPELKDNNSVTMENSRNSRRELRKQNVEQKKSENVTDFLTERKKAIKLLEKALKQNVAYQKGKDIPFSSEGLASYVNLSMKGSSNGNTLFLDEYKYQFRGDGQCTRDNACIVKIDVNANREPNVEGQDIMYIKILASSSMGYKKLELNSEQIRMYTRPVSFASSSSSKKNNGPDLSSERRRAVSTLQQAAALNNALGRGNKYEFTSGGLTEYFALALSVDSQKGSTLTLTNNNVLEFHGDGFCYKDRACYVIIDVNGKAAPNKEDVDKFKLGLRAFQNNYGKIIELDRNDVDRYLR